MDKKIKNIIFFMSVVLFLFILSYFSIGFYYKTNEKFFLNKIDSADFEINRNTNLYYSNGLWNFTGVSQEDMQLFINVIDEWNTTCFKYSYFLDKNIDKFKQSNDVLIRRNNFIDSFSDKYFKNERLFIFLEMGLNDSLDVYESNTIFYSANVSVYDVSAIDDAMYYLPKVDPLKIIKNGEDII